MKEFKRIFWSQRLLLILAAPIVWFLLTSGIFAFITGSYLLGTIEILIALAILIFVVGGQAYKALEGRSIQVPIIVIYILYSIAVGFFKISDLTTTDIFFLGKVDIPNVILIISAIGYLTVLVFLIYGITRLLQSNN